MFVLVSVARRPSVAGVVGLALGGGLAVVASHARVVASTAARCYSWIWRNIMIRLIFMILKPSATSHSIWNNLETLFRDNKQARIIELDHDLHTLTLGDLSISDYCECMKVIFDLLTNIGSQVPEQTLVTYLINGLSPKFDNIATMLRHQDPLHSLLKCRSILSLEERTINRNLPTQPLYMDHASSPTVLHVGNHNQNTTSSSCGGRQPNQ
ncbi:uncharacterized protein LOC111903771 [Lactuca sativa]|uniref:uncharacterized protein LOC111903771 n=1 Tax=Lactuca sativa TaxID=4236 RepID=UPI000CD9076E|nr:uncharacterized protein LOC111903771 [Lactuca sativa]